MPAEQSTRPQTIGYSLVDSPVGQAAWIYEKFYDWTDIRASPRSVLDHGRNARQHHALLAAGRGRLGGADVLGEPAAPAASAAVDDAGRRLSIFPREMFRASRRWAEKLLSELVHFGELEKGGHFAAFEQPEIFVDELRKTFASLR